MIMMIFVTTTDALADEKLYEKAYSLIPEYRKAKADKMKMRENKLQTVTAGLLLNYAVGKWSIKTGERDYKTDEKSQYKESENEIIMKTKNKFNEMSYDDKVVTINGLLDLMHKGQGNLSKIGLGDRAGRTRKSAFKTKDLENMTFIDKSVTGIYERRYKVNGMENGSSK